MYWNWMSIGKRKIFSYKTEGGRKSEFLIKDIIFRKIIQKYVQNVL